MHSEKQLEALGQKLGRKILKSRVRSPATSDQLSATVFALVGELGAGKTTFLRGFAKGLGIKAHITSPTFVLARRHPIQRVHSQKAGAKRKSQKTIGSVLRTLPFRYFWHIDAYRLRNERDLASINFQEIISNPHIIVAIEWADRVRKAIPRGAVWITFMHHKNGRKVIFLKNKLPISKLQ